MLNIMEYGKLINGSLQIFQTMHYDNGGITFNPTHEQWIENGYFLINDNRIEDLDGFYLDVQYVIEGDTLNVVYNYKEIIGGGENVV